MKSMSTTKNANLIKVDLNSQEFRKELQKKFKEFMLDGSSGQQREFLKKVIG